MRDCVPEPQRPHACMLESVVPGSQPVPNVHEPHAPQSPHPQVSPQVRDRVCV
jgi:hypothetical protein